jgi:hypothetical protein
MQDTERRFRRTASRRLTRSWEGTACLGGDDGAGFASERLDDGSTEHAMLSLFAREPAARTHVAHVVDSEASVGELAREGFEDLGGLVLVDHPGKPRRTGGGAELPGTVDPNRPGARLSPEVEDDGAHATSEGIAGGAGGPHGVQAGPNTVGCNVEQHVPRTGSAATYAVPTSDA